MYADRVTKSMQGAMDETNRRRKIQEIYNKKYKITPESIKKDISTVFAYEDQTYAEEADRVSEDVARFETLDQLEDVIKSLEEDMKKAAKALEFEEAAEIRDNIKELKQLIVLDGEISTK